MWLKLKIWILSAQGGSALGGKIFAHVSTELVKKTAEYAKKKLAGEPTGHDWYHVQRVWKMSKRLQAEEGGDSQLIELAALLHDLGDNNLYEFDDQKGFFVLHGMMDVLDIEEELQEKIIKIVDELRYKGDGTKPASTLEGRIVQDADWLESLGAIGVARIFATGGRIKRMLHDPEIQARSKFTVKDYKYKKTDGTSLNYFYEKSFRLTKIMNTKTAKHIAEKRAKYLENFIEEFLSEWKCER